MKKLKGMIALVSSLALVFCFTACSGSGGSDLSAWTEGGAVDEITAYVDDVTDEGSDNFIPAEDRIVVWDMDGTFAPETTAEGGKTWPELQMLKDYIATEMKDDADAQKALKEEEKLEEAYYKSGSKGGSEEEDALYDAWDELFDIVLWDCTPDEMIDRLASVMDEEYEYGLTYKEAVYAPMKQMYDYLLSKDFKVYFCSGSDRYAVFTMASAVFNTDEHQVAFSDCIGADFIWDVEKDGTPVPDDYVEENEGPGKCKTIATQIGKCPVLAFGNNDEVDGEMLNYTKNNESYKSLAVIINHDDSDRETSYDVKRIKKAAEDNGWLLVSVKKDFAEVFAGGED